MQTELGFLAFDLFYLILFFLKFINEDSCCDLLKPVCVSVLASLPTNIRTIWGIWVLWRLICLKRPWGSPKISESQKILTHRMDSSGLTLWAVTHGLVLAWAGMYPSLLSQGWNCDYGRLAKGWREAQNYNKPKMWPRKGSKGLCLKKS